MCEAVDRDSADRARPPASCASPPPPSRTPSSSCRCRSARRCPAGRRRCVSMPVEHRGGRTPRLAVERVDRQPGLLVASRTATLVVEHAADAVLGAEERDQLHVLARAQSRSIVRRAVARAAGVVGEQADALASQRREALRARARRCRSAPARARRARRRRRPTAPKSRRGQRRASRGASRARR